MGDTIIKVEGVGKKYIIGHQRAEKYTALRDVMANNVKSAFRRTKQLLNGNFLSESEVQEDFWAINDISFDIKQGDRVGIIGRNGAGKSTLLKILSRITEPTRGTISIEGRVASLLEVGTGFHPELSGRENVYLNGAILGMSRAEIKRKFDEIVAFAEVEKFLDTPVKRYSSGMYVRLAFAVAAHLEPEILIVDEVLAVGDAQFQKKCLGKMEDVSKNEGRTVLFVSHNMGVIAQLCQKSILLSKGKIVANDTTINVIDSYLSLGKVEGSNRYICDNSKALSEYYFDEVFTTNQRGEATDQFGFDDTVKLVFKIIAKARYSNVKIGFNIQNSYGTYVSTSVEAFQYENNGSSDCYNFQIAIPPSIIAPNTYGFRCVIFSDNGKIYDLLENECRIKINDTGTKLSSYEGIDYGSVILNFEWEKIK